MNEYELSHENAIRLWNKRYGKQITVLDFAGRKIVKSAYNDMSSQYAWGLEQILPSTSGGGNLTYNLIICHQLTKAEKADKFPYFTANGENYEIVRVQNHYEIHLSDKTDDLLASKEQEEGLFSESIAKDYLTSLPSKLSSPCYLSIIQISLTGLKDGKVFETIKKIFAEETVILPTFSNYKNDVYITSLDYTTKNEISRLLDKCVLLNTYLTHYFEKKGEVNNYSIYFTLQNMESKELAYRMNTLDYIKKFNLLVSKSTVYIDSNVINNSKAQHYQKSLKEFKVGSQSFYEYNFIFKKTADFLKKLINE